MTTVIDITRPLEAVRKSDGKIVPMTYASGPDANGMFKTTDCPCGATSNENWHMDGRDWCLNNEWFIRNAAPAIRTAAEQLERMEAFVRKVHRREYVGHWGACEQEADAIAALLPEPVDPDIAVAEAHRDEYARGDSGGITNAFLSALKRGRQLEREGK